jgi:ABC-type glutathione transport system ATPase component
MYPAELSTGMCQRVMIAMALAMGVKLLLADEPLSRIDPRLRQKVVKVLETIRQQRKMAMLLTTHDLALLRRLADTIVMLYKGKVVEVGPTDKVLGPGPARRHEYTQRLLEAQRLVAGGPIDEQRPSPVLLDKGPALSQSPERSEGSVEGPPPKRKSFGVYAQRAGGGAAALAFLKGLRKQVPPGRKLVEIETGHWIRM